MEAHAVHLPRSIRLAFTLITFSIILLLLYFSQQILIPVLLALLSAILLRPLVVFFNRRLKFPYVVAVLVTVALFVIFVAAILFFISWQASDIAGDWKSIKEKLGIHFGHVQHWVRQHFDLSYREQQSYISHIAGEGVKGNSSFMSNTLSSFSDILLSTLLIPIYTFLILLYRNLFLKFLYRIVPGKSSGVLSDILAQVKTVVQGYIVGLLIEMGIVGVLTTGGLMLLGVKYAVLLGIITAILNLVPYIGIVIATVITLLATLGSTSEASIMLGVVGLSVLVQFIDNNIVVPKIVGNRVRINAMVSMIAVISGGAMAGVAGMFLALPVIAVLKVVFDRIEMLAPWGFLMGDDVPGADIGA